MGTSEFNARGNPAMDLHPIQGGVEILPVRNRDKLRPDRLLQPSMGTSEFNAGGNPAMDLHPIQGGVEILPVRNRDKLRPDGSLGLYADFNLQ